MNYQSYVDYTTRPPNFNKPKNTAYYDEGYGIPKINPQNMTIQDIYRTHFLFNPVHPKNYRHMAEDALKGMQTQNEVSKLFFSDRNVKRLQKMIKKEVFKRTKGKFKLEVDQDVKDLYIAMRAVYYEYARYLPRLTVRQVKILNRKLLSEIISGVITNVKQYFAYQKEINKPLTPIPRPINVNNSGRKNLPSITTIWE